jgi:hypothetical protein
MIHTHGLPVEITSRRTLRRHRHQQHPLTTVATTANTLRIIVGSSDELSFGRDCGPHCTNLRLYM